MSRPVKRRYVDHTKAAARLRAHPRMWLPVGEYRARTTADGIARAIRNGVPLSRTAGSSPYAPAGSFDARMDLTEFGVQVIARYIGKEHA